MIFATNDPANRIQAEHMDCGRFGRFYDWGVFHTGLVSVM